MRIAVMTDIHANLAALEAALRAIRDEGCDAIYCTGDAIAIGPQPAECVDLVVQEPVICCKGNHEAWFVDGLPQPRPEWLTEGEIRHQQWTHAQLGDVRRRIVAAWPYRIEDAFEGVTVSFVHYGLDVSGQEFLPIAPQPDTAALERVFARHQTQLVFFGHDHAALDMRGHSHWVNPGALGCGSEAVARYCLVEFHRGQYAITHRAVAYDDAPLFQAYEARRVPERAFLRRAFHGGRR